MKRAGKKRHDKISFTILQETVLVTLSLSARLAKIKRVPELSLGAG